MLCLCVDLELYRITLPSHHMPTTGEPPPLRLPSSTQPHVLSDVCLFHYTRVHNMCTTSDTQQSATTSLCDDVDAADDDDAHARRRRRQRESFSSVRSQISGKGAGIFLFIHVSASVCFIGRILWRLPDTFPPIHLPHLNSTHICVWSCVCACGFE